MIETRHLNSPRRLYVVLVHGSNMDLQIAVPWESFVATPLAVAKRTIMFLWSAMNFVHMSADSFNIALTNLAIMMRVRR
jgi:hypothetical protein